MRKLFYFLCDLSLVASAYVLPWELAKLIVSEGIHLTRLWLGYCEMILFFTFLLMKLQEIFLKMQNILRRMKDVAFKSNPKRALKMKNKKTVRGEYIGEISGINVFVK
jgi:hypothetical protein